MNESAINSLSNNKEKSFEQLSHWISFYSKQSGINFIIDETLPAPAGVPDNSEEEQLTILLNPKLLKEKFNLSNEELLFVFFHEIEHLIEDAKIRQSTNGKKVAQKRLKRFEDSKHLAKSLHSLENILRDVHVNNNILKKTPVLHGAKNSNYRNHFFKEKDFLNMPVVDKQGKETGETQAMPKHLQFAYTILREAMLPNEKCNIEPRIRQIVDRMKRAKVIDKSTTGDLSKRLEIIWKYIEPTYKKLLEEDIKENKKNDNDGKNKEGDSKPGENGEGDSTPSEPNDDSKGEGDKVNSEVRENDLGQKGGDEKGENQEGEGEGEGKAEKGEEGSLMDKIKKKIKELTNGDKSENDGKNKDKSKEKSEGNDIGKENNGDENKPEPKEDNTPKNPFDDLYDDKGGIPHILEKELDSDDLKKVKKEIAKKIESLKPKSRERLELEKRAENMGVDTSNSKKLEETIKQLSNYDRFLEQLKSLNDSETGNGVMEEIYNLFQNIRSKRLKPRIKSKGPVDIEHGARLDPASIVSGIGAIKSGNFNPLMFQKDIKHEKEKFLVGDFELSIVADGSGSMDNNQKNAQQKIACLLIFEALKMLHDKLEMEKANLLKPVNFSTDGVMFDGNRTREIKKSGTDFSDKDRLKAYSVLDYCDGGSTNDYDGLKEIIKDIDSKPQEYLDSIKNGKTKKIVLVLSDGGSSNETKMKEKIDNLRKSGVLVYGIGITSGGSPVVDLFDSCDRKLGFGKICENSSDLAKTLKDLLLEHIQGV